METFVTRLRRLPPSRSDFNVRHLRHDIMAGLTVAVVALPLALGFGVTTGVGAAAGVTTAIVAGIVAGLFGGSSFQISGPTGAMTVVLLPIVATHGVSSLVVVGLGAGLVLVALSLAGVGKYINYIPWPVVTGFTNGIALIIFLQQMPLILGVEKGAGESIIPVTVDTIRNADALRWSPIVITLVAVAVMVIWPRVPRLRAIPASMVALVVATVVSLGGAFDGLERVASIPRGLTLPDWSAIDVAGASDLFRAILAIAVLAALESLLSAVVADGMTVEERHDPDRELLGQGLANMASAVFGGMPATGALARTAVNVRSGARTRLSAVVHGIALLAVVLFVAPLASRIPLAALGGILMVVAFRMAETEAIRTILRATRSDAFVFALTFGVTVFFDLIVAIEVGMVAAGILFIVRMSKLFSVDASPLSLPTPSHDTATDETEEQRLLTEHIVAYRIDGPVFFGAANRFFDQLVKVDRDVQVVILRMRRVPVMDVTGASALRTIVDRLNRNGILVLVSGLQQQPEEVLDRAGLLDEISRKRDHLFPSTDAAIQHALVHLRQADHMSAGTVGR